MVPEILLVIYPSQAGKEDQDQWLRFVIEIWSLKYLRKKKRLWQHMYQKIMPRDASHFFLLCMWFILPQAVLHLYSIFKVYKTKLTCYVLQVPLLLWEGKSPNYHLSCPGSHWTYHNWDARGECHIKSLGWCLLCQYNAIHSISEAKRR